MMQQPRMWPGTGARAATRLAIVALALAAGGCSSPAPEADAGKEIASAFLEELRRGKVNEAWAATTTEFKSMLGLEGLKGLVRKNRVMREPAEFVGFKPVEREGLHLAEYSFRAGKAKRPVKVMLGLEGGAWKVERLSLE